MIEKFRSPTFTQLKQLAMDMSARLDDKCAITMTAQSRIAQKNTLIQRGELCPIIVNPCGEANQVVMAEFGMSPEWAKYSVSYPSLHAPMEIVSGVKTFRKPYRKSQFCLVPMTGFYINDDCFLVLEGQDKTGHEVFTVPALYEYNRQFATPVYSFSLLTKLATIDYIDSLSSLDQGSLIMQVLAKHRDLFLVSNWKFNKGYMNEPQGLSVIETTDTTENTLFNA